MVGAGIRERLCSGVRALWGLNLWLLGLQAVGDSTGWASSMATRQGILFIIYLLSVNCLSAPDSDSQAVLCCFWKVLGLSIPGDPSHGSYPRSNEMLFPPFILGLSVTALLLSQTRPGDLQKEPVCKWEGSGLWVCFCLGWSWASMSLWLHGMVLHCSRAGSWWSDCSRVRTRMLSPHISTSVCVTSTSEFSSNSPPQDPQLCGGPSSAAWPPSTTCKAMGWDCASGIMVAVQCHLRLYTGEAEQQCGHELEGLQTTRRVLTSSWPIVKGEDPQGPLMQWWRGGAYPQVLNLRKMTWKHSSIWFQCCLSFSPRNSSAMTPNVCQPSTTLQSEIHIVWAFYIS